MSNGPITFAPEDLRAAVAEAVRGLAAPVAAAPLPASPAFAMQPASALAAASPWAAPTAIALPGASGVLIAISVSLPDGREATVQLLFGAEHVATRDSLVNLIGSLIQSGIPVKAYAPRENGGGWGGRGRDRGWSGGGRRGWRD